MIIITTNSHIFCIDLDNIDFKKQNDEDTNNDSLMVVNLIIYLFIF